LGETLPGLRGCKKLPLPQPLTMEAAAITELRVEFPELEDVKSVDEVLRFVIKREALLKSKFREVTALEQLLDEERRTTVQLSKDLDSQKEKIDKIRLEKREVMQEYRDYKRRAGDLENDYHRAILEAKEADSERMKAERALEEALVELATEKPPSESHLALLESQEVIIDDQATLLQQMADYMGANLQLRERLRKLLQIPSEITPGSAKEAGEIHQQTEILVTQWLLRQHKQHQSSQVNEYMIKQDVRSALADAAVLSHKTRSPSLLMATLRNGELTPPRSHSLPVEELEEVGTELFDITSANSRDDASTISSDNDSASVMQELSKMSDVSTPPNALMAPAVQPTLRVNLQLGKLPANLQDFLLYLSPKEQTQENEKEQEQVGDKEKGKLKGSGESHSISPGAFHWKTPYRLILLEQPPRLPLALACEINYPCLQES
jgi:hypothetical protein